MIALSLAPHGALGAVQDSYEEEVTVIPTQPSKPPLSKQIKPPEIPRCERYFLFDGRRLECDSNVGRDAERLRPLMKDVPEALAELDIYQQNLQKVKLAAYLGTAAAAAGLFGLLISGGPTNKDGGGITTGGYFIIGGAILGINSFIYGFSLATWNERHISRAVDFYNAAHPERTIELQFSTHVNF
jgi:hypothetical protein